jgi:hypothetical protein
MADSDRTATQSHEPSLLEKAGVVESVVPSTGAAVLATNPNVANEKSLEDENTSNRNSQASLSGEEDDFVYPKGFKLAAITIALCLSVFCMALVSHAPSHLHTNTAGPDYGPIRR